MEKDLLDAVLDGHAWAEDAEAFSEATGVVVAVLRTDRPAPARVRCPVCLVPGAAGASSPSLECLHHLLAPGEALAPHCRDGMPCTLEPLPGHPAVFVMVGGYVRSDVERKELLARLLAGGLDERQARRIARATPLLRPQAAQALARLAASHLAALVDSAADDDERALEYELLYELGRGFDAQLGEYERLPEAVLDRAMKLTTAEAGAVYLLEPDGRTFTSAAASGEPPLRPAERFELGEGTLGHAATTERSLLVSGFADARRTLRATTLAVPLQTDGELVGLLVLVAAEGHRPLASADIELMELYADSAARALVNARRYTEVNDRVLELAHLNELSKALNADAELDRVAYLITSVLDKVLEFEVGGLLLLGREEPARIVLRADVPEDAVRELLAEVAGYALGDEFLERCTIVQTSGALTEEDGRGTKWTVLAEDIATSRRQAGYLFIATRDAQAFSPQDARLLRDQAAHASAALEKSRTYARLRGDLDKLISTLSAMADAAERTQGGHADRVMTYALEIGEEMGLPASELEALRFAGLLHDIGKLGVSEEIILKPSRLTAEEMAEVRRHAEIGAHIVDQMEFLDAVAPIILHHHERWDGGGYPKGLAGEEIPLPSRILAVADSYDAMTSDRTYSKALPLATARIELERGAGNQFDPDVVETFLAILDRRTAGALHGLAADDGATAHLPA